ncbi:MAG: ketopantoate reductase family protein [Deltaproteobacteria bacterium]|nr:ketopantoate reductase family protein [Deltaproteobacteria bacterium]
MKVLILGAGAMGSLVGARLSRTDAKVVLFSTNRRHMETVVRDGLIIEELDGSLTRFKLDACYRPEDIPWRPDLVIVLVKSYATQPAVASVKGLCRGSTIFLTLQNGVGNWERVAEQTGKDSVLIGSTAQGATLVEAGRIRHGGKGLTVLGEPEGEPSRRSHEVAELLRQGGMETQVSGEMELLIWEKLQVNVGINAITALTGIRNGVIAQSEEARALSTAAVEESVRVSRAKGFPIREDMVERVMAIARATAVNRSSMGQDVDRRKRTEIDAINGAIVRLGEELQIPVPVNRTLTQLVKILESQFKPVDS